MALDSYSDLVAAVTDWMDDASLAAQVPVFIRMAEARFNRDIRHPDMEAYTTLTFTSDRVPLPTGFMAAKTLWTDTGPELDHSSLANLKAIYDNVAGTPVLYTVSNGQMIVGPAPTAATVVKMTYYTKLAGLSTANPTNWLLTDHPDLYLYGCLVMAEARGWNDARLPMFKGVTDQTIAEINMAGIKKKHGGQPLVARNPVTMRGTVAC